MFQNNLIFYAALIVVLAGLIGSRSSDNIAAVNSNTRLLPIYSVETPDKTIAITFDSAWRTRTRRTFWRYWQSTTQRRRFCHGRLLGPLRRVGKGVFLTRGMRLQTTLTSIRTRTNCRARRWRLTRKSVKKNFALTGKANTLYRSPYGEYNNQTVETINNMGYSFIQWDVDSPRL